MKNHITLLSLITLFLISSINLFGQNRWSKQASSIDVVIGGDFGFRLLKGDDSSPGINEKLENREAFEKSKLNYRYGINYYQGISASWLIKTGIRFSNPGFSISSIEQIDVNVNINDIKKAFLLNGPEYRYKYQMLEIPLGLKYVISGSKCNPYVEFGASANLYSKTTIEEISNDGKKDFNQVKEKINKLNYIGFIGFGGNFYISENISGFSQFMLRYQLNNLRTDDVEERMVAMGLELGIKYHLPF